jgi:hypothetical protein
LQPYNVKTTKKDLLARLQNSNLDKDSTLSPATLQAMEQNKRDVDAGILPRYVNGPPTEAEKQAERVLDFTHAINFNQPREKRWRNQS